MDICAAFHAIETSVWDLLQVGRREQHQLGEETITDLISLALKTSQKQSVRMINYTKPQEGRNGADWLWIFYDPSTRQAIGIRIQAKIINFKSNRYPHLHYTKNGIKQIDKLERLAIRDHVTPLYVFYSHWPRPTKLVKYPTTIKRYRSKRQFGCAIATLPSIRSLKNRDAMKDVGPHLHPWHVLVCPGDTGIKPILNSVSAALGFMFGRGDREDDSEWPKPRPINEFPPYIGHLLEKVLGPEPDQASEGEGQEAPDEDLAGVVIFLSPTNGDAQEEEAPANWRAMAAWSSLSHPGEGGDHA